MVHVTSSRILASFNLVIVHAWLFLERLKFHLTKNRYVRQNERGRWFYDVHQITGKEYGTNDPKVPNWRPSRSRMKMDGCLGDAVASDDDGDGGRRE